MTGFRRLVNACGYSMAGLRHAMAREAAIRQELAACVVLIPAAVLLPVPAVERLLIILSMLLVVLTEFINSAIEAAIDRISLDRHPLSKKAKDTGSAAVLVSIVIAMLVWAGVLFPFVGS